MTELGSRNVAGMLAQRWALVAHLGTVDTMAWNRPLDGDGDTLHARLLDLVRLHGTVLGEEDLTADLDPAELLDEFDRRADLVERHLADIGDDRWHLSIDEFGAVGGTARMAVHRLVAESVLLALQAGAPVPPPAREAAAAAVAWRAGDNVEVVALVQLRGGERTGPELVVGGGEPEVTVRTDALSFICAGFGLSDPRSSPFDIDGPDDRARAFLDSFTGSWHQHDRDELA